MAVQLDKTTNLIFFTTEFGFQEKMCYNKVESYVNLEIKYLPLWLWGDNLSKLDERGKFYAEKRI